MKLNDLRPPRGAKKPRRRLARGNAGQGGKYGGRGRKGQGSRAGGGKAPYFEGGQLPLVRRLPYRRGFKNIFRVRYSPVNLATLEDLFEAGAEVTPVALAEMGVLRHPTEPYKVLGDGGLTKSLMVHAPRFSAAAGEAIRAVGGDCVVLPDEYQPTGLGRRRKR